MNSIVVVGGGLAGLRTAEALRREGFAGRLTIVGDEGDFPPYDRPPLSKRFLAGAADLERIRLKSTAELGAEVILNRQAAALDVEARTITLDDGATLHFDGLVIATGVRPRNLPGPGVTLRRVADSVRIKSVIDAGGKIAVVGAGFIGCEVASTASERGCAATLIEVLPLPLGRILGERMGSFIAELHRSNGVDVRLGVGVDSIGDTGVHLTDGAHITADLVVVGIGVVPNIEWLDGCGGITVDNGVVCDEALRAADGVVAVGDVCRWYHPRYGEHVRVEHWTNAVEQSAHAARTLLGRPEPFAPVPYFWSDQWRTKLQFLGRAGPDDDFEVEEGDMASGRFVATYTRKGELVGALCVSMPARMAHWQQRLTG